MRELLLLLIVTLTSISCGNETSKDKTNAHLSEKEKAIISKGSDLFNGKGTCSACHKEDAKSVGPTIKEIASIYSKKGASISEFINGEGMPIIEPSQYEIMATNFEITKAMTDADRKAIEAYILNFK